MLNTVIIEDEHHSREALKNLIDEFCPDTQVVAMASTVPEGVEVIKLHQPDLVFLDIKIHTKSGFDVLERVQNLNFDVIFTTAYKHYALKAIKFSAVDYLLKPIDFEELQEAVSKVEKKRRVGAQNQKLITLLQNMQQPHEQQYTITLSTSEGYEFINVTDIIYLEADGSYTRFHLKNRGVLIVSKNLKEYENLLKGHHFYRIHHSFLVNISEVERYIKSDGGYLVMKNGAEIGISPKKKDQFMALMRG